jgi:alpha-beta hydrolase superfamily lysophospholipase
LYGHGKSEGVPGCIRSSSQLLDDLVDVVDGARNAMPEGQPLLLLGHSMGGLIADFISHDVQVVAAYKNDPLVHDRISGLLAKFIADAGPAVIAAATSWVVPTLVLYAGQDKLVNPRGSRAFISKAPSSIVSPFCFEAMYHEIFNEPNAVEVFAQLKPWLDTRF